MPRLLWQSQGGRRFLMSEVPLQEVEHDRLAMYESDPQHEWPLEGCDSSRVEGPYSLSDQ